MDGYLGLIYYIWNFLIYPKLTSIPPKRGNETPNRTSICFKNERNLRVDNISLGDEKNSRKISENKLHQTFKLPYKNYNYMPRCQGCVQISL